MKLNSVLCLILIVLGCGSLAQAKDSGYKNLAETSKWSADSNASRVRTPVASLPYKNVVEASKWSKLTNGRALTVTLRKRSHGLNMQDENPDALFTLGAGGCNWSCCFKTCFTSAVGSISQWCIAACGACGLTGNAFSCGICLSCGVVNFAVVEFCALHCCVDPGC